LTDASDAAPEGSTKYFVLDTNVLLHNPEALFMFKDNHVVIPFTVIEELDQFKKNNDDVGRNARQVIRHLDVLRRKGKLAEGVQCNDHGGTVKIDFGQYDTLPMLNTASPDNRIIAVAHQHLSEGHETVVISKDINARIKSDALGITTMDFEAQKVDVDRLYTGYVEAEAPCELIDSLYDQKQLEMSRLEEYLPVNGGGEAVTLYANRFVLFKDSGDQSHTGLGRRLGDTDHVIPVSGPRKPVFGILPRNVQQRMALDLLLDDEIKLVTLLGSAGSGKTLLALAAGMTKAMKEKRYDRLLVARPIQPMGRDLGYLPGSVDEKLMPWMQPIFDNLGYLLSSRVADDGHHGDDGPNPEGRVQQLLDGGRVILEPLTYIRGRSIPNQFMIVDEAQNLTPHEVKTIASRAGEGTKLILTGDVAQIDNPYLDSSSNGLSYLVEALKGSPIVGHVMLEKSERSELASLVAEKL
jgi:PhoH-like ATPase